MAKVYLDSGDTFTLGSSATVFGAAGTEKVLVSAGVSGVIVDQNVERVDLAAASSGYTYQQAGNTLQVYSGATLIASIPLQGDADGTQVAFTNGSVSAKLTAGVMTLGGATVPSAAPGAVTPTTISTAPGDISGVVPPVPASPTFSVTGAASVTEGSSATYTVTLSAAQSSASTVTYTLAGTGGAVLGTDTGASTPAGNTGTLTFAAGEVTKTVVVPFTFDTLAETGEGVSLTLSAPSTGITLGTSSVTTAIADPTAPTFTVTSDGSTMRNEGNTVTFSITPSGPVLAATSMTYTINGDTLGGVATAATGADFSTASGSISFAVGQTTASTVKVDLTKGDGAESLEGYKFIVLDSSLATLGSVTGQIIDADATSGVGSTFTLTTNADAITGTGNNDTFSGVAGTGATFGPGDVLEGGLGVDTLRIVTDAAFTIIGANVTGFEKVQVTGTAAMAANAGVTFSNVTGLTDLVNNSSSALVNFGVNNADVGNDVPNAVNLTINGATAGTTVTYSDTALTGSADAMTLTTTSSGTATAPNAVTIFTETAAANELETLNIVTSGTNGLTLVTDGTQTSLKTINISGSGDFYFGLTADNLVTNTVTLTSTSTGNTFIGGDTGTTGDAGGVSFGAANHKITLGTGNDSVFFGANLNSSDTVVGGNGTDTLGVTQALGATTTATNTTMTNVSGFETIRFDAGANITQDASATSLAGMNYELVSAAWTYTLNNVAASTKVKLVGGAAATTAVTETLKDSSGLSDALSFEISNGAANAVTTLTTLTAVTGLETLNLSSTGGTGTNVITTLAQAADVVLTGSAGLTVTNALATSNFKGGDFTGKLTATLGAAINTSMTSGSGADSITTGTGTDTVNTGSGNDLITDGTAVDDATGADVLFGGTGNDTFHLRGAGLASNLTNYTTVLTIKDFTVGTSTSASDFVKLSDTGLYGQATALTSNTGAQGSVAAAEAVVVQSLAQNASAAVGATANFFKLSTGVAFTTDFQGTFNAAIGTGSITGLVAGGAVYAGVMYDTTNSKAILFAVNDATATNTVIDSGDAIKVIGAIDMTAADYANFNAINFAAFG